MHEFIVPFQMSDVDSSKENRAKNMGPPSSMTKKPKSKATSNAKTPTKAPSGAIPRRKLPLRANNQTS